MKTAFDIHRENRKKRTSRKNCFLNINNQIYCDACKVVLDPTTLCAETDIYHPGHYDCPHCGSRVFISRIFAKIANTEIVFKKKSKK